MQRTDRSKRTLISKDKGSEDVHYSTFKRWIVPLFIILCIAFAMKLSLSADSYANMDGAGATAQFDLYDELGVNRSATVREIKTAFRRLANVIHPDKIKNCDEACNKRFKNLQVAYKTLSNVNARKVYDSTNRYYMSLDNSAFRNRREFELVATNSLFKSFLKPILSGDRLNYPVDEASTFFFAVLDPTESSSESVLKFFSQSLQHFAGRVKLVLVDASQKSLLKQLPFSLIQPPFFFLQSALDMPITFTFDQSLTPQFVNKFVQSNISDTLIRFHGCAEAFKELLKQQYNSDLKIIIGLTNVKLGKRISSAIRAHALDFFSSAQFYVFPEHISDRFKSQKTFVYYANDEFNEILVPHQVLYLSTLTRTSGKMYGDLSDYNESLSARAMEILRGIANEIFAAIPPHLAVENMNYFCGGHSNLECCLVSYNDEFLPINLAKIKVNKVLIKNSAGLRRHLTQTKQICLSISRKEMLIAKNEFKVSIEIKKL